MEFGGAFWKLPNLKNIIFIDGGTEQVRTVDEVFNFYTGEMLSN